LERDLKRDIEEMLDVTFGPTGAHPQTTASVEAVFSHVKEVAGDIRRRKQHCKSTPTGNGNTEDTMQLD